MTAGNVLGLPSAHLITSGVRVSLVKCSFVQKTVKYLYNRVDAEAGSDVKYFMSYLEQINYWKVYPPVAVMLRPLHLLLVKYRKRRLTPDSDDVTEQCTNLLASQQRSLLFRHT